MISFLLTLICLILVCFPIQGQPKSIDRLKALNFHPPVKGEIRLSGNFAEFRSNHFHSGLDIKTGGIIGWPVYAIDRGYVSRILVLAWGAGKTLFIDHPCGLTSVYMHLDRFHPSIESLIKKEQLRQKRFDIDLNLSPKDYPIKGGDLIAHSGNSGSSGGPHLHLEIRETSDKTLYNPISLLKKEITDTRPPQIQSVAFYPQAGVVNGKKNSRIISLDKNRKIPNVQAWGEIGVGIQADDLMNNTTNRYGVRRIQLFVDNVCVYESNIDSYLHSDSRYMNSHIDFEYWKQRKKYIDCSFILPNALSDLYTTIKPNGIININQERIYKIRYVLTDDFQNKTTFECAIKGVRHSLPNRIASKPEIDYTKDQIWKNNNVQINLEKKTLYDHIQAFKYTSTPEADLVSAKHKLHTEDIPLNKYITLTVRIENDLLTKKENYYMTYFPEKGFSRSIAGKYLKGGYLQCQAREFGSYGVSVDTIPPQIEAIESNTLLRFKLEDKQSGVAEYKATLDGKFLLFEQEDRSTIIRTKKPIHSNKKQEFILQVKDLCGNETVLRRVL